MQRYYWRILSVSSRPPRRRPGVARSSAISRACCCQRAAINSEETRGLDRIMAAAPKAKKAKNELTVSRPALLVDGSDRSFRQLVHDMLAFSARIQEVRGRLGSVIGLSGTQYTVLIAIAHLRLQNEEVGVS